MKRLRQRYFYPNFSIDSCSLGFDDYLGNSLHLYKYAIRKSQSLAIDNFFRWEEMHINNSLQYCSTFWYLSAHFNLSSIVNIWLKREHFQKISSINWIWWLFHSIAKIKLIESSDFHCIYMKSDQIHENWDKSANTM